MSSIRIMLTGALLFSFLVLAPISITTFADSSAPLSVAYAQQIASTTTSAAQYSVDCSISLSPTTWGSIFSPTCWGRTIATIIGTALIWLASWILEWAGLLFDWVVTDTILQFGNLVTPGVLTAINTAWSAFRDVSNIVIIGMFTFIALATILGNVNYGAKKMISRVLIVAILINFSLLFTKIIIDTSNFTAVQFLNAASTGPNCTYCSQLDAQNQTASAGTSGQQSGIAGAFLTYAGAQTFGNAFTAVNNIAQDPNNGGWYALLYGFVVGTLELTAAAVLFYGAFLLIARALLMIFLMVTSSVAFASYLLPSNITGSYGWGAWWSSLLKNAVFAPLLAVLLWVALTIAQAYNTSVNPSGQVMSLGALIPQQGQTPSLGIEALFGYIIVIGLLFIAIKISSSFSSTIGGFNVAQAIVSTPLGVADRLAAFGGRQLIGRGAAARAATLEEEAKKEAKIQAELPKGSRDLTYLSDLMRKKEKADTMAKRTFDGVNTNIGQRIAKGIKMPGPLAQKTTTSFADSSKHAADEAAKTAVEAAISKEDATTMAKKQIDQQHQDHTEGLKIQHTENSRMLKALEEDTKNKKDSEGLETKLKEAMEHIRREQDVSSQRKINIEEGVKSGSISRSKRDELMREEDKRIEDATRDAHNMVRTIQGRIDVIEKPLEAARIEFNKSKKELEEHQKDLDKKTNDLAQEFIKAGRDNVKDVAANLSQNWLQRRLGLPTDTVTSNKARKLAEKKIKVKPAKDRRAAETEEIEEANEGEKKADSSGH